MIGRTLSPQQYPGGNGSSTLLQILSWLVAESLTWVDWRMQRCQSTLALFADPVKRGHDPPACYPCGVEAVVVLALPVETLKSDVEVAATVQQCTGLAGFAAGGGWLNLPTGTVQDMC